MKYLDIPTPITVTFRSACGTCHRPFPIAEEKVISYDEWLGFLLDDPKLYKTPKDSRLSNKMRRMLEEQTAEGARELAFEDHDYERLKAVYNDPSFSFHPNVSMASEPFMDSFESPRSKPLPDPGPESEPADSKETQESGK
jgi:hypothetical protein